MKNGEGSPTSNRGGDSARYRNALRACSDVAREEFVVASESLRQAEKVSQQLRASVSSIARSQARDGAAIEDARGQLREVQTRLDSTIAGSLADTKRSLDEKREHLARFTVTLFGRTMAGKSTVRETLTRGDGATIGKGAQRTTRDVREYEWNALRIVDTPGIGAYEGTEDQTLALSMVDQTDVILFLASSDGIQEESFRAMQAIRQQNKPLLFILNVKRDLGKPVFMRRFLADPESVLFADEIQGHIRRIEQLAYDYLGMRDVRVLPIHAQAAYLSTRPEHATDAARLAECSRLGDLLDALEREVLGRGTIRRAQTLVDGTVVSLLDLQGELREQSRTVRHAGTFLKNKFAELDVWLDSFVRSADFRSRTEAALIVSPLRNSISAFVEENIEREDVGERWQRRIKALGIEARVKRHQTSIVDEFQARLAEFSREMSVETPLIGAFGGRSPDTYDPADVKRSLKRVSAGGLALAGLAGVAGLFGAANFWNPVGWILGGAGLLALGLSWFFDDREEKLQRQKARAAEQLRGQVDQIEKRVTESTTKWFHENIEGRYIRAIRDDTRKLYTGMFEIAALLDDGARQVAAVVERLDRRLLVRTGSFLGLKVTEAHLARVVRDPGVRAKFVWSGSFQDTEFCRRVGMALGEFVDGVAQGPAESIVAGALRPAVVKPSMVSIVGATAIVRVPSAEAGKAIGRGGSNISLACRLAGLQIKIASKE